VMADWRFQRRCRRRKALWCGGSSRTLTSRAVAGLAAGSGLDRGMGSGNGATGEIAVALTKKLPGRHI